MKSWTFQYGLHNFLWYVRSLEGKIDYYTRVCVTNKKVNIDISQAPNKMWANAFSTYIFTQPAAFPCVFLWRKKHLKVYNMNGTIIHFKSQWNHCTRYLLLCENGLISYQVTVGGENFNERIRLYLLFLKRNLWHFKNSSTLGGVKLWNVGSNPVLCSRFMECL